MKNKTFTLFTLTALSLAIPGVLQAVAIPPELIQNEIADSQGTLYAVILVVLIVGIALGIWVQQRLEHPPR